MVTLWERPLSENRCIINRDAQAERMFDALVRKNARILMLCGDYGVGKTFLAKYYAEKYADIYPGGVIYCQNFLEFQSLMEKWAMSGFPKERFLAAADELTQLDHLEPSELKRFMERFVAFSENSRNVDVLIMAVKVPMAMTRRSWVLETPGMTNSEGERFIAANGPSFGFSEAAALKLAPQIIGQSGGNPRRMLNMLYLLREESGQEQSIIETIPCLVDSKGRPLSAESREYGSITTDLSCVNDRVLRCLEEHPEEMLRMSPREFEMFTAAILEKMGYEISLTPQTRDGGVDIFAAKKEKLGSFLYLVQCKKQSEARPVGISVIRELYGVLQARRATYASVVTTSYFSKNAWDFQRQFEHQMSLIDYENLKKLLRELK